MSEGQVPTGGFGVPDGRGQAPVTVRLAAILLFVGAGLTGLWAAVGVAGTTGLATDLYALLTSEGGGSDSAERFEIQVLGTVIALGLIGLILTAMAVTVAVHLRRDRAMAYWWALGLCALQLAVSVFGAVNGGVQANIVSLTAEVPGYTADFDQVLAVLPDWYVTYTLVHDVASPAVYALAGFLLVLPGSGDHFARRQPPGAGGGGFEVPR